MSGSVLPCWSDDQRIQKDVFYLRLSKATNYKKTQSSYYREEKKLSPLKYNTRMLAYRWFTDTITFATWNSTNLDSFQGLFFWKYNTHNPFATIVTPFPLHLHFVVILFLPLSLSPIIKSHAYKLPCFPPSPTLAAYIIKLMA